MQLFNILRMSRTNDDFYVVLPSNNSSSTKNTPAEYLTQLHSTINLDRNANEWEVGLVEITFVNSLKTIDNETITISKEEKHKIREVAIHNLKHHIGYVENHITLQELDGFQHSAIPLPRTLEHQGYIFRYDEVTGHYTFESKSIAPFDKVTMSNTVASILGFHPHIDETKSASERMAGFMYYALQTHQAPIMRKNVKQWTAPYLPAVAIVEGNYYLLIPPENTDGTSLLPITTEKSVFYKSVGHEWIVSETKDYVIPPGYYKNSADLALAINNIDGLTANYSISILYDVALNRFQWELPAKDIDTRMRLTQNGGLSEILGFSQEQTSLISSTSGNLSPDLRRGIYSLYIYCDICSQIYVGNALVPLLRTVSFNSKAYGDTVTVLYDNPIYVPIIKRSIDKIEILIYDDAGRKVPFIEGKTVVTLHFRRRG